jgi:magnesium transporter
MSEEPRLEPTALPAAEDRHLDAANLEAQWHEYSRLFDSLIERGEEDELARLAAELSTGDLSEIVRPLSVDDTAKVLLMLPPEEAADLLAEIDKRSVDAVVELLDIEAIADLIEDMPSDEAADLVGELDHAKAHEILAAMEPEERDEVRELLQYEPDTAGGIMAKEFIAVPEDASCLMAVDAVRGVDEDDREALHFIFVVDREGRLVGRIPLVEMLMQPWATPVAELMEREPRRVDVDLDQEDVVQYVRTHDLVTLPVIDRRGRLVGVIHADDALDVLEEEATEDIAIMAGTSEELGETSPVKVARARLPWLVGALAGQVGCVLMMQHFEAAILATVALTFFIPAIMAMGGNTGIQTSSVVVRGLATGEVDVYHMTRYLSRELGTALLTGGFVSATLFIVAGLVVGNLQLAIVLSVSMMAVIICAALVGTGIPLMLHRFGIDPAIATGPFITTSNDILAILIYLGMATLLLD